MTLTAADAKKMRFTLRYPPDKILDTFEGSFTATQATTPYPFGPGPKRTTSAFSHNLGAQAYLQMRYSQDGGTTWQDQHVIVPDYAHPDVPSFPVTATLEVGCYCTSTQIVMVASNWTGSDISVMYEVVAFAMPGVTYGDIPTVTDGANKFTLSSRFNIQKIYLEDSIPILLTASAGTVQEYTLATHSLGYIPSVRVFYTLNTTELWPLSPNEYGDEAGPSKCQFVGNAVLTDSLIKARVANISGSNATITFRYRVYLDE